MLDAHRAEADPASDKPASMACTDCPIKLLYRTFERYPTHRVDVTELFSAGLAGRGHEIDWVMQSESPDSSQVLATGRNERTIMGKAVPQNSSIGKVLNRLLDMWLDLRMLRLAWGERYDAIQVRDRILASVFGLIAAKLKGIPFFYWMSYPYVEDQLERARIQTNRSLLVRMLLFVHGEISRFFLYRVVLHLADHVFVQSDEMLRDMVRKGVNPDRMSAYPMCIRLSRLDPDIEPHGDPRLEGRLPVIYVGTMVRVRRLDFLVRAFAKVREEEPKALLLLVGSADPIDMQPIEEEVKRLGLEDDVLFTGFVPMRDAWSYTLASKVGVSPLPPNPILDVGSPTKVAEYLAWNIPVVVNDHPDQGLVVKESGAGLVVPYEETAFAEAVLELLKDAEKAKGMGLKGYPYVAEHRSYEALCDKLDREYRSLIAK